MKNRNLVLAILGALAASACPSSNPGKTTTPPTEPTPAPTPVPDTTAKEAKPMPPKEPTEADKFAADCRADLAAAKDLVGQMLAVKDPRTVENTLVTWNQMSIHLYNAGYRAGLMSEVHPDKDFRAAAETCTKDVSAYQTELSLNPDVYKAIAAVDTAKSDADTKRLQERTLRDFRRAGVDKDEPTRKKIGDLSNELVATGIEFDKNIREDVHTVKLDPAQLKGLPDDYIKQHPPGADGKVTINTDYPDYLPFRSYAEDGTARKALFMEYLNRGWPKNDATFKKLLVERREYAKLLGYKNYAEYITEDKMIKSPKNARDFIEKITKASEKRAKHDYAELLKRKQKDDKKAKSVEDYEKVFYAEKVKKDQYAFDSQSVRPYFEFRQTRDGLLATTAKLYGIEYREVKDAPKWHADVDVYDVYKDGQKMGRIFLDLHPREGKYKHAAQFPIVAGVDGVQLPEGALVCNFPDPNKGEALMDHDDVVTMFHEFGHLMHHVLGGHQKWIYFSGVATEQDFVEAPSQMFEEWAWDPAVLATFAKHKDTHQPIPAELVKKMRRAHEFGKGSDARQQMFYAALSLGFYEQEDPEHIDATKFTADMQKKYGMFAPVDGTHLQASFGHLNGYSAVYYTYMWSLVIAKDLFTEFHKHGMMDETTAHKYRDLILAKGGSKDAADLVHDFLGRPYDFKAYEAWLNQD